jgi:hypothetical protein
MKIGVAVSLDRDAGELFADAKALEAAGADSFWGAPADDQMIVLAAIAAVTWRARMVAVGVDSGTATNTLAAIARGRLLVATIDGDGLVVGSGEIAERWIRAPFPDGRAGWQELRAKSETAGIAGIVLPNDPRLLDLVRNPDVEDDRSDLKLAFG